MFLNPFALNASLLQISKMHWIFGTSKHFLHSFLWNVQVLVKWYNIYNAPGGPSAHAEWSQFVTCFLTLMGYNTERLAWTRQVSPLLSFSFFNILFIYEDFTIPTWKRFIALYPQNVLLMFCKVGADWKFRKRSPKGFFSLTCEHPFTLYHLLSFPSCILKCLFLQLLQRRRLVTLTEAVMRCVYFRVEDWEAINKI